MDTTRGNTNQQSDKLAQLRTLLEHVSIASKIIGTAGIFCGFIYLFAYTSSVGIPFPLELSVLPTMLLLVGTTSVIGIILLVGGILVPALMADEPMSVSRAYFLATEEGSTLQHPRLVGIKRYFVTSWAPMAIAFLALMVASGVVKFERKTEISLALLFIALCWIICTSFIVRAFEAKRLPYILTTCFQTLCAVWSYCLGMLLFVSLYPKAGTWEAFPAFLGALGVFTLIHMFITLPHRKSGSKILTKPYFEHEVVPATTIIVVLAGTVTALSLFMAPFSAKVGKVAMHVFGVGGGVPIRLCLKNKPPADISDRIVFSADNCSEVTSMLFDVGDKIYITKASDGAEAERDNAPTRQEFVYFRQDEVREKIYPLPAKKGPNGTDGQPQNSDKSTDGGKHPANAEDRR